MAAPDALRRLGGGRWETKDGRFQIEPQSGTWVIVDTTQTNEFGLPLVRGPFPSLGAAREAIETARTEGPAESPLADRIEQTSSAPPAKSTTASAVTPGRSRKPGAGSPSPKSTAPAESAQPAGKPAPPPEPRWLRALGATDHRKAKQLMARLEELGIGGAEDIARAEVVEGQPALARLALERRLAAAIKATKSPRTAGLAVIEVILAGEDDEDLGAQWRLVDARGRRIETIDPRD
jgi:hypothetical protein